VPNEGSHYSRLRSSGNKKAPRQCPDFAAAALLVAIRDAFNPLSCAISIYCGCSINSNDW